MPTEAPAELTDQLTPAPLRRSEPVGQPLLSRDGERALRDELTRLRRQLEVDFSERLKEARGFGESHENDDYLQIKEEESVLTSRIQRLQELLDSAGIVDESAPARGVVSVGVVVELSDLASGRVRKHRLVGGFESTKADDMSVNSPIGQALLGRRRGDEVTVQLPGDRSAVLEIVGVRSPRGG